MKTLPRERPYVSSLGIGPHLALASAGMGVLSHVTATHVFRRASAGEPTKSCEIRDWARTEQRAYETLLSGMQMRAQEIGASGVVAADFQCQRRSWDKDLFELSCQGTAVSLPEQSPANLPFVCALSGPDLLSLWQSGYTPLGHVFGFCAYYQVAHLRVEQGLLSAGRQKRVTLNVERSDFTRGYYAARARAMQRLEEAARRLNADGVIGVQTGAELRPETDHAFRTDHVGRMTIEFMAQGTAIGAAAPASGEAINHIVRLDR